MKNYKYLLLVSTYLLFNNNSLASELDLTFKPSSSPLGINATLNTHTPNVELKPISNLNASSGIKLAAVCALAKGGCDGIGFSGNNDNINLDTVAQCKDEGFVNSCSSRYCMDKSCSYNSAYGKCISESCPTNSSSTCTGAVNGKNACGNNCYRCCSDECPKGSKNYNGSYASTTECGNKCYNCNTTCPSGSLSYSGSYASKNECGSTCYNCSNSCPSGYSLNNPGGCYDTTSNQCGNTCYKSKPCCSDTCSRGSKYYSGSYASTTECGSTCYNCSNSCPSGSTSYSGSYAGSTECGNSCYYCSDTCSSGSKSSSCSSGYTSSVVGSTECGSSCYSCSRDDPCTNRTDASCSYGCKSYWSDCSSKCQTCYSDNCRNRSAVSAPYGCQSYYSDCSSKCQTAKDHPDCNVTSKSCSYGCASTNSCDKCISCNPPPAPVCSSDNTGSCADCPCKEGYVCNDGYCDWICVILREECLSGCSGHDACMDCWKQEDCFAQNPK